MKNTNPNKETNPIIDFGLKKQISRLIKVVGVGGAGSNAVNYMFSHDTEVNQAEYIVLNTDKQALNASPVPRKLQLGKNLTNGLGAGSNWEIGRKAAQESEAEIRELLAQNTKMVFITAGMGGGTGTGAAPVVARIARDLGLLTVAIVTLPFEYEGAKRQKHAREGVKQLEPLVDSLIVINNEKIIEEYGDLGWKDAFAKSDQVLYNAVISVTKVITDNYEINVDFNDVEAVLKGSGTALISTATAGGENRADRVVEKVLNSPLLDNNNITGAKDLLLLILSGEKQATVKEIDQITKKLRKATGNKNLNIIQGLGDDPNLHDEISVTIMATGFNKNTADTTVETPEEVVVLGSDERPVQISLDTENTEPDTSYPGIATSISQPTDNPTAPLEEPDLAEDEDRAEREWELFRQEQQKRQVRPEPQETKAEKAPEEKPKAQAQNHQAKTEPEKNHFAPTLFDQVDDLRQTGAPDARPELPETPVSPVPSTGPVSSGENPKETAGKAEIPENSPATTPLSGEQSRSRIQNASADTAPATNDEEQTHVEILRMDPGNLSNYEQDMMNRFDRLEKNKRNKVNAANRSLTESPIFKPRQSSHNPDEINRLKKYNHRFDKNFDGPVVPPDANGGKILNLNTENPRWDDDSYINQKFD